MGRGCWLSSFELSTVSIGKLHFINSRLFSIWHEQTPNYANLHFSTCSYERYLCWSDFIECKQNGTRRPFFAYSILVICTLTLIISIGLNGWAFESFSTNPSLGPSPQVLMQMGAKQTDLIVNSYEIWRIFSPMILREWIDRVIIFALLPTPTDMPILFFASPKMAG